MPAAKSVDGSIARTSIADNTSTSIRDVARLIADVTDFMTLAPGDVLTLGVPHGAPIAHVGDEIGVAIGDWPPLCFSMTAKEGGGQ